MDFVIKMTLSYPHIVIVFFAITKKTFKVRKFWIFQRRRRTWLSQLNACYLKEIGK
jgi:hypothetical protein